MTFDEIKAAATAANLETNLVHGEIHVTGKGFPLVEFRTAVIEGGARYLGAMAGSSIPRLDVRTVYRTYRFSYPGL